jgi:putative addiction module killer protein
MHTTRLAKILDSHSFINEDDLVYDIQHYKTLAGKNVYMEWRKRLRDHKAALSMDRRLNRVQLGNFGDHKPVGGGISELRIDIGPGYRIYYAVHEQQIVLLLCGGDKSTQSNDISNAIENWNDWKERTARGGKPDDRSNQD